MARFESWCTPWYGQALERFAWLTSGIRVGGGASWIKKGVCGQFFSQHTPINSQRFGTVALLFVGLDFARLQFLHVLIEVSANLTAQNVESQDVRKGHAENHDV